jgi:putative ABC transport system permease protein
VFLALKEVRRARVRFGLVVAAVALLAFLILFQQALRDGLVTAFVGAVRNQTAPVLVYNVDAQRTLQGSVIPPELERQVLGVEGIGAWARVGEGTFTVVVDGDDMDASVIGTDDPELVRPATLTGGRRPAATGEAVGSAGDFVVGDAVEIVAAPGGPPVTITVVGVARDIQLSVTATLFTDFDTFAAATRAANPDATVLPSVLAVAPAEGTSDREVVDAVNAAAPDAEALTRADAADDSPGVAQVRQSFLVIFVLYGLVVPLVTGLFFLIVTLQKAGALTLLRAVGARTGVLARSLILQVGSVLVLGLALGTALWAPVSQMEVGGLSLRFDPTTVLGWSAALLALGLLSALAALRRVLAIDPVEATAKAGVR